MIRACRGVSTEDVDVQQRADSSAGSRRNGWAQAIALGMGVAFVGAVVGADTGPTPASTVTPEL